MPELNDLDDLVAYAQGQVERIQRMQDELGTASAEATSRGGYVRARTGAGGALLDLRIEPAARQLSTHELAAEVTDAVGAAQARYAELADTIMAPVLGLRPSEESVAALEGGMSRLDALADDLDRLARRYDAGR